MNKKEYYQNSNARKRYTHLYKYVQSLLKEWKVNNNYVCKCVVHHRDDTEECRKYNEEHYELWGFNEDGTFEYGKYVIFMTHAEHSSYHHAGHNRCAGENNPMYGRHRSGINAPMYGKKHSTETREKMILHHANVAGENNPFYGKTHSNEVMSKLMNYHRVTSNAYKTYKNLGGTLSWKEFRHAIKIGEIDINNI